MMEETLKLFFTREFEIEINEKMMYKNYKFDYLSVLSYVNNLINIEYDIFIEYILNNYDVQYLTSDDVLQYSDLYDATINICSKFKINGDSGYRFIEIGKMLENDGIDREDGAYRKYGENHSKVGENIGLLQKIDFTYYLSCLGAVLDLLTDIQQEEIINRLLLRNKLIRRLIYKSIAYSESSYSYECGFLKESTMNRRKANIKKIIKKVAECSIKYKDEILKVKF